MISAGSFAGPLFFGMGVRFAALTKIKIKRALIEFFSLYTTLIL